MPKLRSIAAALVLITILSVCLTAQEKQEAKQNTDLETAYKVGDGVSAPRAIETPNAQYTPEARRLQVEGRVILWLIVGVDGLPHNIKVARGLGYGLDAAAVNAVSQWEFKPGRRDGRPVPVQINVEVSYHLK